MDTNPLSRFNRIGMAKHVKWYVNVKKWIPTREEWVKLAACIPKDELDRVNKFVFQEDSKSSLVGQVLIRTFLSEVLEKPSNELKLTRSVHGRPEICKEYKNLWSDDWPNGLDFNVSHSGDFCVLVGYFSRAEQSEMSVGVDVTKIVRKDSREELERFLSLMSRREFSHSEWSTVEQAKTDRDKCINFTRLWCLKESYIKSIGLGLAFKLRRIEFIPKHTIPEGALIGDTKVLLDGSLAEDWRFLETAIDADHLVSIGYRSSNLNATPLDLSPFEEVKIERMLTRLAPLTSWDNSNWIKFTQRSTKS